jgi:glycosyltransferase involved in cell wall biosynthesis
LSGTYVVAVTASKGRSWGFADDVVHCSVNPQDYQPHLGAVPSGLRIANFIQRRRTFLCWTFYECAFAGVPVRLIGYNPDMPGVAPSRDWDHLKDLLSMYRFYVHTAHPELEDGFNMATMEAMAAGLPILGNRHPTSIVEHGVSGFLSDDPAELRRYARLLLDDGELALRMGQAARDRVRRCFSVEAFRQGMERAIEAAQRRRAFRPERVRPTDARPEIVELPASRTPGHTATHAGNEA